VTAGDFDGDGVLDVAIGDPFDAFAAPDARTAALVKAAPG
jgi:hypothetical protein